MSATMSKTTRLKAKGLPSSITKDVLRTVFKNRRGQGGGPVKNVELNKANGTAVITFENSEAVDIIWSRGNTVKIENAVITLYRLVPETNSQCDQSAQVNHALPSDSKRPQNQSGATAEKSVKKKQITPTDAEKKRDVRSRTSPSSRSSLQSENFKCHDEVHGAETLQSIARRTVKAKVRDVTESKDFFCYYLNDISDGQFDKDTMLLDGLRGYLYVTFHDGKDARALTPFTHGKDSNFCSVEIATEDDFNFYKHLISVHGFSFDTEQLLNELAQFISERTGLEVEDILCYDEPKSVVVVFPPERCRGNIGHIAWTISSQDFLGVKLLTAPVYKNNMVIVSNLNSHTTEDTLVRYLRHLHNGGDRNTVAGPVEWFGSAAIVTLRSDKCMNNILSKAQHTLEDADLHICHYHPCLRTDVYEKYIGNHQQMPEVFGRDESQQPEPAEPKATPKRDVLPKQWRETTDFSKNDETCYQNKGEEEDMEVDDDVGAMHGSNRKESRKQHSKKEEIKLKVHELDLLQQTILHNSLKQNPRLEVIIGRNHYVIEGDDETLIQDAGIKVLKLLKDSQATTITNLEQDQIEVLCEPKMQVKLKEKFIKKNITVSFERRKDEVVVHSFPSSDQEQIKKIVTDQVSMGDRPLGADELFVLQSIKGQEFLKKLKNGDDDCTAGSLVKIDGDGKKLVVVGSLRCQREIEEAVKTFMREYKLTTEMLDVPKEVQEYIRKFQKPEFDRVVNFLHGQGTEVQCMLADDKIRLKGPEGGVGQGKTDLSELCKAVASKSFNIKLFGIKEFLGRNSGKEMKEKIEGQFSCLIKEKSARDPRHETTRKESALSKSKVASIAEMTFQNCVLHFQQGDILDTNVDAIAHAVDISLKLKTALGKAILSRGGQSIEAELEQHASGVGEGDVLLTSAGRLPGLKAILHVVCPVFGRNVSYDVEILQACINTCLAKADQQHFPSIAFPIIGAGRIFKFPETAAGKFLMEAIKVYLEENENTNLERIVLCDMQADNLTTLMERCKNVFRGEELETLGELKDEEVKGAGAIPKKLGIGVSYSGGKNFGHISVSVVEGELTKQKVNVIVSVVDKSLDLSRGRISSAVSEDGGSSVQRDLRSRYKDGIHSGEFAETRGGDLKCKNIFHACLPVWDHGKEAVMGKLVLKMLERADQLKAKSMAFPALGTGGLRYPADVSAHTIMDAISQFAMDHPRSSLKNISLVIFHANKDVARTFKAVHSMAEQGSGETSGLGGAQSTGKMTFGSVTLTVKNGDITDEKCDVIVNGIKQDMDLSSSGAVCKALLKKCGSGLQHDCKSKAMEMTRNGLVVTSGQGQPWKNIIHLSNEKFGHNIDQGVAKALEAAEQLRARSLALPVFGAARKGADVSHIKDMIFGAVRKFGTSGRHTLSDIRLVVFSKDMMDTFLEQGHHSHHSHHSSQSARRDHSPAPAPARVSERLDLTVYAKDTSDCEAAIKALTDACKQKFEEKKVSKDHLSQLSPKQIKEFEAFGLKHHLQVSVRTEERSVVIRGFENTDGMMEVQNKLGDLLIDAVQNLQRAIPLAIQWQYKSGHKWRDFEPLANSKLEIEYGRKSTWHDLVDARGRKYRVDFKNMKEHILDDFGKSTGETVDIQRNDRTKEEPVPKRWDPMLPDEDLKLVFISPQSKEYKKVEQRFRDGGANVQIRKIERVQNKALYQQYAVKRREIEARNPKGHENEKILYHGTKAGSVNAINQNGFNRSYCGANATMFGEGVYFAKQSGYSVTYAEADQFGTRKLYQARVLVGESVVTKSDTKFLTNKPNSNFPYDSGTDPVNSMYIIFHDAQAVPEYLITF